MFFFFFFFFFFNDTATTEIYTTANTLSLHDALPISRCSRGSSHWGCWSGCTARSEEHTSELQSLAVISYAVFCLKKKKKKKNNINYQILYNKQKKYKKKISH